MTRGIGNRTRRWALALAALAVLAAAGCDSVETRRMRAGDKTPGPQLQVELCRKVSKKGKRLGVGREFMIGDKSSVLAFADFSGLRPERDYTVHLVWIRPDGAEMFRRFAEFRLEGAEGARKAIVQWKDALDLNRAKREELPSVSEGVTLDTTLNLGTDKKREPGTYRFRVYLDRRLVREESFAVVPFAEIPTGRGDDDGDDQEKVAPAKADAGPDAAKTETKAKSEKKSTKKSGKKSGKKSEKSGESGKAPKSGAKSEPSETAGTTTTKPTTAKPTATTITTDKPTGGAG